MTKKSIDQPGTNSDADVFSLTTAYVTASVAIAAYVLWFGLWHRMELSKDPEHWAQFGDYFTGVVTPVITFFALFWLILSVKTQRTELTETKQALVESAIAQEKLVKASLKSAEISALSALIEFHANEIKHIQLRLDTFMAQDTFRTHQCGFSHAGILLQKDEARAYLSEMIALIAPNDVLRSQYQSRLRSLLEIDSNLKDLPQSPAPRTSE